MTRAEELLDAHRRSTDAFAECWERLEATPDDLEALLVALTPGMSWEERDAALGRAATKMMGSGWLEPH